PLRSPGRHLPLRSRFLDALRHVVTLHIRSLDGPLGPRTTSTEVAPSLSRVIRHVVMFRWSGEASDEAKQAVADGLAALPAAIPEIRRYEFGPDAGLREGNWDFVVVGDFDDVAGYQRYAADERHQSVISEHIAPIISERAAVQYEVPG
ncbi:MAG: Dabb family protein, partial [Actinomycetota bacterium]